MPGFREPAPLRAPARRAWPAVAGAAMALALTGAFATPAGAAVFPTVSDTCAVKTNSTLTCWELSQDFVPADLGTVTQVSADGGHTCAIRTNATLTCWGDNRSGQTTVPADLGTVTQVSAGGYHTCAVKTNGTLTCWGRNGEGQASVPAGLGTVTQVSAGGYHTCAVKTNGTLACWGYNFDGQTNVPAGLGAVTQVSTGFAYTCAIKTNATLTCWGDNYSGQMNVPADLGMVTQVSTGWGHACAVKTNATLTCWGSNTSGQRTPPAGLGAVTQVSAGVAHTCAVRTNGTLVCWGRNTYGETNLPTAAFPSLSGALIDSGDPSGLDFGDATAGLRSPTLKSVLTSKPAVSGVPLTLGTVTLTNSGGGAFTLLSQSCTAGQVLADGTGCALRVRFTPKTWQRGEITGSITITDDSPAGSHTIPLTGTALAPDTPVTDKDLPSLSAGSFHTCAVKTDATLACWGSNGSGQTTVPAGLGIVTQVSVGSSHSCAVTTSATPVCWGANTYGQRSVPDGLGAVTQLSAGSDHTCALKADRTVACWGYNFYGQSSVPVGLEMVTQVSAGTFHTCALKTDATLTCWGGNASGQRNPPAGLGAVTQVSTGAAHTCALKNDRTVACWGDNYYGQSSVPTNLGTVTQVSAGGYHTCAVRANATLTCWGDSASGKASVPADLGTVTQVSAGYGHTCAVKTNATLNCWGENGFGQRTVPASEFLSLSAALVDFGNTGGLDFGDVAAGSRSPVLGLNLRSEPAVAGIPLTLGTVTLSNSGGGAFSLLSQSCTAGQVLADGASCTLRVRFTPKIWQRGDITGQITVTDDSAAGTRTIPLTGTALPPASFILQNATATPAADKVDFAWETSDDSKVTVTIAQPVTTTVKVKQGKKTVTKKVTTIKQLPLTTNLPAPAGPGTWRWDRKITGKPAAKGTWTWFLTAKSSRGTVTKTASITLG